MRIRVFTFISFIIILIGIVPGSASNDINVFPIWTVSEDQRIWINIRAGEQVGFSSVVCILNPNESITFVVAKLSSK